MINPEIYKEILFEYERLQDISKIRLEEKKQLCYKKCKKIEDIDNKINMTAIEISKILISANKEDKQKYIDQIKSTTESLKIEKEKLMMENGFSKYYFDDIYKCNKCKDTGYISNKKCECFNQKLVNRVYALSDMSQIIKNGSFSSFHFDYYSKEIYENEGISAYDNMKKVVANCTLFVEEFDENFKNMLFNGKAGLGKTFLCGCIGKELINKGKVVLYTTASEMFKLFTIERFSKSISIIDKERLKLIKTVDLLVIDDLGTEAVGSSTSEFFNIINYRILNKKSTIISTNLSAKNIRDQYSERIFSRLYGEYDIYKFFGQDIRLEKKIRR